MEPQPEAQAPQEKPARAGLSRRRFLALAGAGGLSLAGAGTAWAAGFDLVLEEREVVIPGLDPHLDGLRVGLLADLHHSVFVSLRQVEQSVRLLNSAKPDLAVLAGDFVYHDAARALPCAQALRQVDAPLGTYAVLGNHEYWTAPRLVSRALTAQGIRVLVNAAARVEFNGAELWVAGLDDAFSGRPDLTAALRQVPLGAMRILACHEPDYADVLAKRPEWLPLTLSGHSHGGQVVLPGVGPLVLPPMARRYPAGLATVAGTDRLIYTTRGVGHTWPIRAFCPPEATLLVLRSTSALA
jgi:uncharacterized protein